MPAPIPEKRSPLPPNSQPTGSADAGVIAHGVVPEAAWQAATAYFQEWCDTLAKPELDKWALIRFVVPAQYSRERHFSPLEILAELRAKSGFGEPYAREYAPGGRDHALLDKYAAQYKG